MLSFSLKELVDRATPILPTTVITSIVGKKGRVTMYYCNTCRKELTSDRPNYCSNCGQKLKWRTKEEEEQFKNEEIE